MNNRLRELDGILLVILLGLFFICWRASAQSNSVSLFGAPEPAFLGELHGNGDSDIHLRKIPSCDMPSFRKEYADVVSDQDLIFLEPLLKALYFPYARQVLDFCTNLFAHAQKDFRSGAVGRARITMDIFFTRLNEIYQYLAQEVDATMQNLIYKRAQELFPGEKQRDRSVAWEHRIQTKIKKLLTPEKMAVWKSKREGMYPYFKDLRERGAILEKEIIAAQLGYIQDHHVMKTLDSCEEQLERAKKGKVLQYALDRAQKTFRYAHEYFVHNGTLMKKLRELAEHADEDDDQQTILQMYDRLQKLRAFIAQKKSGLKSRIEK